MSILSFTTTPLDLRLRSRWAAATLAEAQEVLAVGRTSAGGLEESVRHLAGAMVEIVAAVDSRWREIMTVLETDGLPADILREAAVPTRVVLNSARDLLFLLRERAPDHRSDLDSVSSTIERVLREVAAVEASLHFPEFDPERLRQGMEEAERGEGEDVEELLSRLHASGDL